MVRTRSYAEPRLPRGQLHNEQLRPLSAGQVSSVAFNTSLGVPAVWSCSAFCPAASVACVIAAPPTPTNLVTHACKDNVALTLTSWTMAIGDGPGNYRNNANCTWSISASGPITVHFTEFRTVIGDAFLKLYDGASTSAPLLDTLSGIRKEAPSIVSSAGALTIVFTSGSSFSQSEEGFTATLSSDATTQSKLVGTIPAALGNLACIDRVRLMYV